MIAVITPTCDRPAGIALLERWMARQTVKPDKWIVADGGKTPAPLTMGQEHRHNPRAPGSANFAGNVLAALDGLEADFVLVMEDDDWYAPNHVEACLAGLQTASAYGCDRLRYWNVQVRGYLDMRNTGSSLAQTAIRGSEIPALRAAAEAALKAGDYTIDGRFWQGRPVTGRPTSIGVKGLPGTVGLGVGHRKDRPWKPDPDKAKLREWIGQDADLY